MASTVKKLEYRLVLLGSRKTGFLFKKFDPKYRPTVEDLFSKTFDLGNIELSVDFIDTSGSMEFPVMRRLSISTAKAFLMVYSVDDQSSYELLKMCMDEIQDTRPDDFQKIPIVFAGNKCDLPREQRKVFKDQVSNYVHYELPRLQAKVIECSCKDNTNIDIIFRAYLSLEKVSLCPHPMDLLANKQRNETILLSRYGKASMTAMTTTTTTTNTITSSPPITTTTSTTTTSPKNKQPTDSWYHHIIDHSRSGSPIGTNNRRTSSMKQPPRSSLADQLGAQASPVGSALAEPPKAPGSRNSEPSGECDLETVCRLRAKQDELDRVKPRSRSMIWRPSRNKSRSGANSADVTECRTM